MNNYDRVSILKICMSALIISLPSAAQADSGLNGSKMAAQTSAHPVVYGSSQLKDMTYDTLTVYGALDFTNLIIQQELKVDGSAHGKNLKCQEFKINGSLAVDQLEAHQGLVSGSLTGHNISILKDLSVEGSLAGDRITVLGRTKIAGNLSVIGGDFTDIDIEGDASDLTDSRAANIHFKKVITDTQKLYLRGKTIVSGDIVFESGKGEIYLGTDAVIKGQVKGATIKK
ncbi:hypothetical protein [Candidatus Odyssella thessalonicensis]|uniref:hypothetical protein n=1 Tax=Candidatus Odyssella thessalonicensis TaxID=84647 RepID=UPI000225B4D8|nr:hypothetical protein [Candidatus Odyssella thessalonicensis]